MGFLAQVIKSGTSTGASSFSAAVSTAVSAGDTVVVFIQTIGSNANISSVSDSSGNTWTLIAHDATSASGNDAACYRSTLGTAWTTSSTFTVTMSGGSFSSITVDGLSIAGAMEHEGTPVYASSDSNGQESADAASSAAGTLLGWFGHFLTGATSCSIAGTGWAIAGTFITQTSNSSAAAYKDVAGVTGASTVTATWSGGSHTGRSIGLSMIATATEPTDLDLTGKRGAIASADSRYGALTTTGATILSLTGKKSTFAATDGRFGQFTAEYLNNGGVAWADARFGSLASAAAITALTGLKGAISLADSRYGTLTTNTRGNLALRGTKTAHLVGESRFGLLSLFGEAIQGLPTTYASADSRFGSLLLHNRTPGVVTIRAENRGLVTVRIGE